MGYVGSGQGFLVIQQGPNAGRYLVIYTKLDEQTPCQRCKDIARGYVRREFESVRREGQEEPVSPQAQQEVMKVWAQLMSLEHPPLCNYYCDERDARRRAGANYIEDYSS